MDGRLLGPLYCYLNRFPRTEKCGLGLGTKTGEVNQILALVWPFQQVVSPVTCQIHEDDYFLVLQLAVKLQEKHRFPRLFGMSAWPHTHPHIGLFLSGLDQDMMRIWNMLDPDMVAIVFDPFLGHYPRFGGFGPDFRAISVVVDVVSECDPYQAMFEELLSIVPERLKDAGRPMEALITPYGSWFSANLSERSEQLTETAQAEKRAKTMAGERNQAIFQEGTPSEQSSTVSDTLES